MILKDSVSLGNISTRNQKDSSADICCLKYIFACRGADQPDHLSLIVITLISLITLIVFSFP
jgi:hypothetical protein